MYQSHIFLGKMMCLSNTSQQVLSHFYKDKSSWIPLVIRGEMICIDDYASAAQTERVSKETLV